MRASLARNDAGYFPTRPNRGVVTSGRSDRAANWLGDGAGAADGNSEAEGARARATAAQRGVAVGGGAELRRGGVGSRVGRAYLPLVRAAHAQDKVVAATADIRVTARGLLPATVRVVPDRSGPGGGSDG